MNQDAMLQLYALLEQNPDSYRQAVAAFGHAETALDARPAQWTRAGLAAPAVARHAAWPDGCAAEAHARWQAARDWLSLPGNHLWLAPADDHGPAGFSHDLAPGPPLLLCQGDVSLLDFPQVAVVGSRAATRYGLEQASRLAGELARGGLVITSGLASGIDGAAHEGALAVSGLTIAVMGCGPERIYPPANQALAARIVAGGGLLVTEFLPGTPPERWHFPRRNRVIAALSLGVLVIEASPASGSLITARIADQLSRPVWALPGPVTRLQARGCHEIIRQGVAGLVETAADVMQDVMPLLQTWYGQSLDALVASAEPILTRPEPGPQARRLRDALGDEVQDFDHLVTITALPPGEVLAALGELEVTGWVVAVPGGYQRVSA